MLARNTLPSFMNRGTKSIVLQIEPVGLWFDLGVLVCSRGVLRGRAGGRSGEKNNGKTMEKHWPTAPFGHRLTSGQIAAPFDTSTLESSWSARVGRARVLSCRECLVQNRLSTVSFVHIGPLSRTRPFQI